MAKQISYSEDARQRIKRGVDVLARAVGVTLGPRGRNVVIDKKFGAPLVTKDGVTVAKEVELNAFSLCDALLHSPGVVVEVGDGHAHCGPFR